ncbi:L-type lectin-domain containing receptor kinase IX.1 [Hibiscus syriacus]|uniref:non-specific serine/threonine protein kinase n=1 Tax=Hibiscus syriacus TaxID=106335 RepID=A0A6A3A9N5_HIBSY|nr:L-type lectin-domain containing receptor kinase IX.1 [Hibiscus syriacus]
MGSIHFEGDTFSSQDVLQLTKNDAINNLTGSVGRASYNQPMRLWDASNGKLTDFTTRFSFVLQAINLSFYGDGISFFIAPFDFEIPPDSSDGYLAMFNPNENSNSSCNNVVAVEFDSFENKWDPDDNHVGININSIVSVKTVTWNSSIKDGRVANAWSTLGTSRKKNFGLIVGLGDGFGVVACALGGRPPRLCSRPALDVTIDDEFEKGTGRKRFNYNELCRATNSFAEEGKLGEGGFGGVYKGLLSDSNTGVAVKRVSRGSKQGEKEYISEVKIISRLRHRNLVQLLGWCHEKGELLVYEFLPNESLDSHLFDGKIMLTWIVRHKMALGLPQPCCIFMKSGNNVWFIETKSRNVMLDSNFNAKLGDFGLARLVDHDMGAQTTVLAGTIGYLVPECVTTSKASKESDVYRFGIVVLEIACGRKPVEPKAEPSKVRLLEWVFDLYGKGQLLEAVDKRLGKVFDERQIECLLITGLRCCHPDYTHRPSIRQVINVLNFEAPLPSLPSKLPVPMYYTPLMSLCKFTNASSSTGVTDSEKYQTQCSSSSGSTQTNSAAAAGSGKSLKFS